MKFKLWHMVLAICLSILFTAAFCSFAAWKDVDGAFLRGKEVCMDDIEKKCKSLFSYQLGKGQEVSCSSGQKMKRVSWTADGLHETWKCMDIQPRECQQPLSKIPTSSPGNRPTGGAR